MNTIATCHSHCRKKQSGPTVSKGMGPRIDKGASETMTKEPGASGRPDSNAAHPEARIGKKSALGVHPLIERRVNTARQAVVVPVRLRKVCGAAHKLLVMPRKRRLCQYFYHAYL